MEMDIGTTITTTTIQTQKPPGVEQVADTKDLCSSNSTNTECANCKQRHHGLSYCFLSYNEHLGEIKISIKDALWTIFEHGIQLNQASSKGLMKETDAGSQIKMCSQCLTTLAELYKYYVEFAKLTKVSSYIQELIGQCSLWEQQTDDETKPTFIDDCSDLIPIITTSSSSLSPVLPVVVDSFTIQDTIMTKGEILSDLFYNETSDHDHDEQELHWENDDKEEEEEEPKKKSKYKQKKLEVKQPRVLLRKLNSISIENICTESRRSARSRSTAYSSRPTEYSCKICMKHFPNLSQLESHNLTIHGRTTKTKLKSKSKIFSAGPRTPKILASSKLRRLPPEDVVNGKIFECLECGARRKSSSSARRHVRNFHLPKPFRCTEPECSESFYRAAKLSWHLVLVHGIGEKHKDQECPVPNCGKYFPGAGEMQQHLRLQHLDKDAFPCPIPSCSKKCSSAPRLKAHLQDMHDEVKAAARSCEHCGTSLKNEQSYRAHIKLLHSSNTVYTCDICGQTSKYSSWLKDHLPLHDPTPSSELMVQCDKCPASFRTMKYLKRHIREKHCVVRKIYECGPCGTKYLNLSSLRNHNIVNHTEEAKIKFHVCPICGKSFKVRDLLRQHLQSKTHGGPGFHNEKYGKNKKEASNGEELQVTK